jgi:hypothetical protein
MEPTFNFQDYGRTGVGLLMILGVVWGIFTTIFWMVCAWYAMRAHQQIAMAHKLIARALGEIGSRLPAIALPAEPPAVTLTRTSA